MKLHNVLLVPKLKCNLVYVSQLLRDSGLVIQLTEKFCVIQYRSTRKVIGAGEQHEGLYFLKGAASVHAFKMNGAASFKLWHRRMGHPSSKVLGLILEVVCNNKNENKVCDVCFRAKQTREMFSSSENKAK